MTRNRQILQRLYLLRECESNYGIMTYRFARLLTMAVLLITLCLGCKAPIDINGGNSTSIANLSETKEAGSIILWHDWQSTNYTALKASLESFQTIFPNVKIVETRYEETELIEKFRQAASLGFGPDLLLSSRSYLKSLADASLIQAISTDQYFSDEYLANALAGVSYLDNTYALPISLYSNILYYNLEQVSEAASTLDALLAELSDGKTVGMSSSFDQLIWGISAFGGDLFDEEGKSTLDDGALSAWLTWLQTNQELPQFFLNENTKLLQDLFVQGSLSYYLDSSRHLPILREQLGDKLGVSTLPSGELGKAAPLLDSDVLYINANASARQQSLALVFSQFLANKEQQRRLLREAKHVPVNATLSIDPRLNPIVYTMAQQAKQSIAQSYDEKFSLIEMYGNTYLRQVIEGVISPETGANLITDAVNLDLGFEVKPRIESRSNSGMIQ